MDQYNALQRKFNFTAFDIRYSYAMPHFKGLPGNIHYITIGIGGWGRDMKM